MKNTKTLPLKNVKNFFKALPETGEVLIRKAFSKEVNQESDNIYKVLISVQISDRDNDVILIDGISTEFYNNVVLWNHDLSQAPIAKVLELNKTSTELFGKIAFATQYEFATDMRSLVDEGILTSISLGFIPQETYSKGKAGFKEICQKYNIDQSTCDRVISKCEMIELSLVPVPANPGCHISKKFTVEGLEVCKKIGVEVKGCGDKDELDKAVTDATSTEVVSEVLEEVSEVSSEEVLENVEAVTEVTMDETQTSNVAEDKVVSEGISTEDTKEVKKVSEEEEEVTTQEIITLEVPTPEAVKAEDEVIPEAVAVEPVKPMMTLKVLRKGGVVITEELHQKAIKFLQGKSFDISPR